jgi:hypothetical protein
MAGPGDADSCLETALPPAARGVSAMRGPGGGVPLGRTVGARDHGVVQRSGSVGTGVELARHGAPLRAELEERGHGGEARRRLRAAPPEASARPCNWNRRSEPTERPGVSHGGLRSGAAGSAMGRRRPDRRGGEAVLHRGNGSSALPDAAGGVHGHVGNIRQTRTRPRAEREDFVRSVSHRQASQ